jgi:hypothetical protein
VGKEANAEARNRKYLFPSRCGGETAHRPKERAVQGSTLIVEFGRQSLVQRREVDNPSLLLLLTIGSARSSPSGGIVKSETMGWPGIFSFHDFFSFQEGEDQCI